MDKPIPEAVRAWKTVHVLCSLMRIRPLTTTEQDELHEAHLQIREANTAAQQQGQAVAWCQLTQSGEIAYFDGKPMIMVGSVGNEHHTVPLYAVPPSAPVGVEGFESRLRGRAGPFTAQPGERYVDSDIALAVLRDALAQQPAAVDGAMDTRCMDWLERHAVEVRTPMRYGSAALFHAEQVSDDDEPYRTNLRAQIAAALAAQHQEPKP